jgi:putative ABC transport system permease protein
VSEGFGLAGAALRMAFRSRLKLCALLLLLLVLSFGVTGVTLLQSGIREAADKGSKRLGADLMVIPAGTEVPLGQGLFGGIPVHLSLPEGIERSVAATQGVIEVAPQYFLASAAASCCDAGNLLLVGFDPSRDVTVQPWLKGTLRQMTGRDSVLAGGSIMKASGATMRFYNHVFTIAARLEKSGLGYFDNAVFIPLEGVTAMERSSAAGGGALLKVPWGRPSILLARLDPARTPRDVARELQQRYPAIRVLTIPELFRENRDRIEKLDRIRTPLVVAAWCAAALAGGAIQLLYWRERRASLGLLQMYGCGKGGIIALFAAEVAGFSLAAVVAGGLGAFGLLRLMASYLSQAAGLPLLLPGPSLVLSGLPVIWGGFVGLMALEGSIIMACMLRPDPADLLRNC